MNARTKLLIVACLGLGLTGTAAALKPECGTNALCVQATAYLTENRQPSPTTDHADEPYVRVITLSSASMAASGAAGLAA